MIKVFTLYVGESTDVESEEEEDDSGSASQDDKEGLENGNKGKKPEINSSNQSKQVKTRDDLAMYEKYFPELFEFQVNSCGLKRQHSSFCKVHQ